MEGFLKQIAKDLYLQYGNSISEVIVVFPNRRAGLFFTDYLNRQIEKPTFAPKIISINDLFEKLSSLYVPDKLHLIFRLYKVYRDLTGTHESFDNFFFWGEMILNDFDQIDKYMADAEKLLINISQLKEIDEQFSDFRPEDRARIETFWQSLESPQKSTNQQEFIRLWRELLPIYTAFKEHLRANGMAYEGMLFRDAIEQIDIAQRDYLNQNDFIFAGFNALNQCEKQLFQLLQNDKKAKFYWDYDHYYMNDTAQEAGVFLRANLINFPQHSVPYSTNLLAGDDKKIKIVSIPSQTGQAQYAASELIKRQDNNFDFDDTAIVLCDETLLLPVLSSIPENTGEINVTMGLPLKLSPLFGLIDQIIELQRGYGGLKNQNGFHHKRVAAILSHQMIAPLYPEEVNRITAEIVKYNIVYLQAEELNTNNLFCKIFRSISEPRQLPSYFMEILNELYLHWEKPGNQQNSSLFREYIYQTQLIINNLNNNIFIEGEKILGCNDFISRETFFKFLSQYLSSIAIPFEGEPLSGLQIMGILETRTLDFKNLIFLSMNDGIMPRANPGSSFIPYNLRRGFGLPTLVEQNAMYAYYFYRALQRAENVTFTYNSSTDGLFTGEKSRFLYQLQSESKFKIEEFGLNYSVTQLNRNEIVIPKNDDNFLLMQKWLNGEKTLSPSALDKYLNCKLRFFFSYVAGLKEPQELTSEVDPRVFGLIVHHTMETLYKPFVGKEIKSSALLTIIEDTEFVNQTIIEAFKSQYFKHLKDDERINLLGQNWIVYQIIKQYIKAILDYDLKRTPFILEGLESNVSTSVLLPTHGISVKIGGIIDRTNRFDDIIEILDYKTGDTDLTIPDIESLFLTNNPRRNKAAFQTLVYSYVIQKNRPEIKDIRPGIYALKSMIKEQDFQSSVTLKDAKSSPLNYCANNDAFEKNLIALLEEIFNREEPFSQTEVIENCTNCPFQNICNREL